MWLEILNILKQKIDVIVTNIANKDTINTDNGRPILGKYLNLQQKKVLK